MRATLGVMTVVFGGLASLPATALGQQTQRVSMDEALELFGQHSLALRIARAEAAEIAGLARQSRGWINPSFTLVNQNLDASGVDYWETIIGVQQQIEWPGRVAARGRVADNLTGSAAAGYASDSLRLAFKVREAYAQAWAAEERESAIGEAAEVVTRVALAAEHRLEEGDISGYEARRLRLERVRIEQDRAAAELESSSARRTLATLVLPGAESAEVGPAEPLGGQPPAVSLDDALVGLTVRPDIEAATLALEAARAQETVASSGWVPDPILGFGYKEQADGFSGLEFQLALPIPLFNRRGGARDAARARYAAAAATLDLRTNEARNDLLSASARYTSARQRLALVGGDLVAEADALREAAEAAYAEGEMTLLELLDGARAFRDTRLTAVELRADTWIAYYDLMRAAGRDPEENR